MADYFCSGTLGDAYINVCKLWLMARKEKVHIVHRTKHKSVQPAIKEIYSLAGITCEFRKRKPDLPEVSTLWTDHKDRRFLEISPYPKFKLNIKAVQAKYKLPRKYIAVCPQSGRNAQGRRIDGGCMRLLRRQTNLPWVIVGTDGCKLGDIHLEGKTSIAEYVAIIAGAHRFIGFQGLGAYVALSHKVRSIIFARRYDMQYMPKRIAKRWKPFLRSLVTNASFRVNDCLGF